MTSWTQQTNFAWNQLTNIPRCQWTLVSGMLKTSYVALDYAPVGRFDRSLSCWPACQTVWFKITQVKALKPMNQAAKVYCCQVNWLYWWLDIMEYLRNGYQVTKPPIYQCLNKPWNRYERVAWEQRINWPTCQLFMKRYVPSQVGTKLPCNIDSLKSIQQGFIFSIYQ